jgi:hypothetical protein
LGYKKNRWRGSTLFEESRRAERLWIALVSLVAILAAIVGLAVSAGTT